MNDKKMDSDMFADVTIPGNDRGGYGLPPSSRYSGMGAYKRDSARETENELFSYDPQLPLISRVHVYSWGARKSFYERFREDAEKYRSAEGKPAAYVPFFSYIPQYSQMNLYQLNFYLYFRERARIGDFIDADLAYILLYVYELINLSDISVPKNDIKILTGLWMHYRDTYPALDKYMSEWVCDYCLLYKLGVPPCTAAILPKLCESATLKEFYMSGAISDGKAFMQGDVLEAFADYNYRSSRIDLPKELTVHYAPALGRAAALIGSNAFISSECASVSRFAFCGSLCAHNVKRRIVVEYYPTLKRSGTRHMLGAAVKYTENKLRRAAGIRSRLHTDGLPDAAKGEIDRYFEETMPDIFSPRAAKKAEPVPEWERLYDAPDIPFSHESAAKIELESRAAAELLAGDDVSSEDEAPPSDAPAASPELTASGDPVAPDIHTSHASGAIRYMLEGGTLEEYAAANSLLPDTVAAEVNEAAADSFGDILLEHDGKCWVMLDDYLEEAAEIAVSDEN